MTKKILLLLAMMVSLPIMPQVLNIRKPFGFVSYDTILLCPRQVQWTIHATDLGKSKRSPSWSFIADIPCAGKSSFSKAYAHSGYHRGHMCPAADRSSSVDLMRSTFVLSNICPQLPHINTGAWKQTENFCRTAAQQYDSVSVLAVPVFLDNDTLYLSKHNFAVPHAFFKAAWVSATDSVIGAWFIFNK